MESLLGFVGKDYVLLTADGSAARSIMMYKHDEDKIVALDTNLCMAAVGPTADRNNFSEFIAKNLKLHQLRYNVGLSTKEAAHFIRGELAYALRRGPYQTNLLVGGVDKETGPALYWMDYLASMTETKYGSHGYASFFCQSIFDRYWKPDMTLDEGIRLIKLCIKEIQDRFLINQKHFITKVIDKNGIREIDLTDVEGKNPADSMKE